MGNLFSRFGALSSGVKAVLIVASLCVLALSVLLSPLVVVLALLVLIVALLALLIRAIRRRPLRTWGLVAGASLALLLVFSGISGALYGGGGQGERADPSEEKKQAAATEKPEPAKEQKEEPKPKPEESEAEDGRYDAVATVSRVVDGDTVEIEPAVDGNDEVRLIGVDTPETKDPSEGVEPYGPESSNYTTSVLEGEKVELEFDEERTDQYGRLLAYVYLAGDEMFNGELVEGGYAQVYTVEPNARYEERFLAAQEEARNADIGIWGLSKDDQCELADRGNGIGEGTPSCEDTQEDAEVPAPAPAPKPKPEPEPKPEPDPEPAPQPEPEPSSPSAPASASPDSSPAPASSTGDLDCSDFDTQAEAQAVYDQDTSDPNGLDGPQGEGYTGNPGEACEDLPGGTVASPSSSASPSPPASPSASPSASSPASSPAPSGGASSGGGDIDCDEVDGPIPTPPGDPDGLDGDGDGLACE